MKRMKGWLSLILTLFLLAGCFLPAFAEDAPAEINYASGTPWLCSFLDGNVTADTPTPALADDFYLACNKDALVNLRIPEGYSQYGTQYAVGIMLDEDIKNLFTSGAEADSHDARLALNLYSLYTDWDSRNAAGAAPLKEMTDAVEAIDSLEALTAYLTETAPEYQLHGLFKCTVLPDLDDSSVNMLSPEPTDLSLADSAEYETLTPLGEIRKNANAAFITRVLLKLGYSEEEAVGKIENCLAFERELAPAIITQADQRKPDYYEKIDNHFSRAELLEAQGNVPLLAAMEGAAGYPAADVYLLQEPAWLAKLNSLYTEENLAGIRDFLIVNGILDDAGDLDRECYDWAAEHKNTVNGVVGIRPDEIIISGFVSEDLEWPVARLYCERYLSQDDKDRISALIDEVILEYHGIIQEADFLSDATKEKAIEKLEAIDRHVLWPDDWSAYDCGDLEIASAAEGGTLWKAKREMKGYFRRKDIAAYPKPVNKDKWSYVPTLFNCGYDPSQNSIMILGAFARGEIYNADMSDEDLYGRLGLVIGHEISHAFDSSGGQFDKEGNMRQWWTDEDLAAFKERNERLVAYIDRTHPWEGQDYVAANKSGEVCADMGGMKCMLRLAARKEGFDYDRFFRSFADLWLGKASLNRVYLYITDEHPMAYLRVNYPLQQYDEFLDFYGIREGDGMYLAPEDRVNIW